MLCANTLIHYEDFENALKRHLIMLYDNERSTNYNFKNCKALACTEVRAAQFHSKCHSLEGHPSKFAKWMFNVKQKTESV